MAEAKAIFTPLEVDDFPTDSESLLSETTSVSSTILDFQYENGRRYHNFRAGKYLLPNDEIEQDRLDLAHHAWKIQLGGDLLKAPIPEAQLKKALDLGTGTGIWAIDFGDEHPNCQVTGTDLSPIQARWVPPNVKFEIDDYEETWIRDRDYDLIHIRNLIGSVKDWPALLKTCYDHMRPGAYIELHESGFSVYSEDDTYDPINSAMAKYLKNLQLAASKIGLDMSLAPRLSSLLSAAGFLGVTERKLKMPTGAWPKDPRYKELGRVGFEVGRTGAEAYGLAMFTRVLGWGEKEAKECCEGTVRESADRRIHMISDWFVVWGRKPE